MKIKPHNHMFIFLSTNRKHPDCYWVNEYHSLRCATVDRRMLTEQGSECGRITKVPMP